MLAYAIWAHNAYGREKGQDTPRIAHWEQVKKASGGKIIPDGLADKPDCPAEMVHVWTTYTRLRKRNPITYQDLLAYQQVTGDKLTAFEATLIIQLDTIAGQDG